MRQGASDRRILAMHGHSHHVVLRPCQQLLQHVHCTEDAAACSPSWGAALHMPGAGPHLGHRQTRPRPLRAARDINQQHLNYGPPGRCALMPKGSGTRCCSTSAAQSYTGRYLDERAWHRAVPKGPADDSGRGGGRGAGNCMNNAITQYAKMKRRMNGLESPPRQPRVVVAAAGCGMTHCTRGGAGAGLRTRIHVRTRGFRRR